MIDLLYRQVGDRRGGQHAVAHWIRRQFDGKTYWKNCAFNRDDLYKKSGFPDLSKFHRESTCLRGSFLGIFAGYEDKDLAYLKRIPPENHDPSQYRRIIDCIVLRDPFNLFASKISFIVKLPQSQVPEDHGPRLAVNLSLWKAKARQFLNEEAFCISFNEWFLSPGYRESLVGKMGKEFRFTDEGVDQVSGDGGGSSFDKQTFDGKARQMNVLKRFREMEGHPLMKFVLEDEETKFLSDQIFGDILEG